MTTAAHTATHRSIKFTHYAHGPPGRLLSVSLPGTAPNLTEVDPPPPATPGLVVTVYTLDSTFHTITPTPQSTMTTKTAAIPRTNSPGMPFPCAGR